VNTRRSSSVPEFSISCCIGITSGLLCWAFLHHFHLGAADFDWSQRAARNLLDGKDPYATRVPGVIPYPLPAVILAVPFVGLHPEIAGAIFFGVSSALLALGLVRDDPHRLKIFLAYPYWAALMTAQWTPLLMSAAMFPLAFAFCLAKPHVGGPIALVHPSRRGIAAALLLLLISLIWLPRWPWEWISQLGGYQHFFPILVFPGILLALALLRYRDRDGLLLLLFCIVPQRWFYDAFPLWLIPKTRRSILATVVCSWGVGMWRLYHMPRSFHEVGFWSVLGFYLPMLAVVLFRPAEEQVPIWSKRSAKGEPSS
jgi:hypothetical protein